MRILHVITSLRTGGAEHLLVDLLPRLRDLGNEVELLLFDGTRTPFYEQLATTGIPIHELGRGGNVYQIRNILGMRRYLSDYDVIHTHNTACQLFAPLAKAIAPGCKTRLFTTEHSSNNRRRGNKWLALVDKWMYSKYERIICISDQPRANLEAHIGKKDSICTIYNGVDTQRFTRDIKDIASQSSFVVTMVASLSAAKDQDTVIRAIALLPSNYKLQLVGIGSRKPELVDLASCENVADRVNFMGMRTDIPDILEQSDIVVLSSHWEGLSLSSIEGMSSGRPFIASDVDGLREVVDGYGLLFPHGAPQALARLIHQVCEDGTLYHDVAMKCQQRAKQYDISEMATNYNRLYHQTS